MAADLGLIAHAAQGHANIFTPRRLGNRLPKRGFSNAWGANKTKNGCLDLVDPLLHSKVFQDAIFDLVEPVVILVEHLLGFGQVMLDLGLGGPGQACQHIDVIAHHRSLGRHG